MKIVSESILLRMHTHSPKALPIDENPDHYIVELKIPEGTTCQEVYNKHQEWLQSRLDDESVFVGVLF